MWLLQSEVFLLAEDVISTQLVRRRNIFLMYWASLPASRERPRHALTWHSATLFSSKTHPLNSPNTLSYRGRWRHGLKRLYPLISPWLPLPFRLPRAFSDHWIISLTLWWQRWLQIGDLDFVIPRNPGTPLGYICFSGKYQEALHLALADPQRTAITLHKAPCYYKHHLLFLSGWDENACECDGLLF